MLDVLEYARSITYVDSSRIGMWGHSQGYSLTGSVCVLDGALLSLNDRLFDALYTEFNVPVTEEMLAMDANDIAKQYLNKDQLKEFEYIKKENTVAMILAWRLSSYVSHRFMFWGYESLAARLFGF